jgi:chemotaxis protein CheC
MSIKNFNDLTEMHFSVLREIGNIGSGNAATALSQMLAQPVNMSTPEVGIVNYNEASEKLGGIETVMAGVVLMFKGDMSGLIMFILPGDVACTLVNVLMAADLKDCSEIDEMGFSAIQEVANVMSASFGNAIADMTGLFIDISPP